MSRCIICNKVLSGFELSRTSTSSGQPLYMCNEDYQWVKSDVPSTVNYDLEHESDVDYVEDDFDRPMPGPFKFYAVEGEDNG